MGLREYKAKRNFLATAEPEGDKPLPKRVKGASRFVIQKHDASRLHYDFRLEMDGVLKSWAVPKGLPWKQGEKHLAVEVEDHPIEYETFEGLIPKGNYGGGTVMVWDRGSYFVYGEDPPKALREGRLHLVLAGEKAKGEYALIRIRSNEEKNQWLLLKATKSARPISKKRDDESVKSGRTMKQIAAARDAEWQSNRAEPKGAVAELKSRIKGKAAGAKGAALPKGKARFIEPMKPRLVEVPPAQGDWVWELKFDGIRLMAIKEGKKVSLLSRNENDLTKRFGAVAEAIGQLAAKDCVIDGEVVALDEEGRSSFQLLQSGEMEGEDAPVYFYAFDLLQANGRDLLQLSLGERKARLEELAAAADGPLRFSGELGGAPKQLLAEVKRRGLEGIIGKQRASRYEPGRRSGVWIKLKCVKEQEFVIGGFTPPQGGRKHFGALLVGYYEKKKLLFAGKVGTGFDTKTLAALAKQFAAEGRDDCPFADLPSKERGQWAQGITPGMMRKMHWLHPRLVAQVKFAEWTRDGKLRQPVYLGLREDKKAADVRLEGRRISPGRSCA